MISSESSIVVARLSIQRSVLGKISPQLRAIVFSSEKRNLDIRFYFDGQISEADFESVSYAEAEILADYEADDTITVRCLRIDAPMPIIDDGVWVYQRRE